MSTETGGGGGGTGTGEMVDGDGGERKWGGMGFRLHIVPIMLF